MIHGFRTQIVLGALGALLLTGSATAADVKLAVVDQRRALISSNEGRKAEKVLKALMEKKREQIEPLERDLKRKEEEFESQKYVLSRTALEERKLELLKQQRDLERSMREAQDELEIEQRKLMQPILKQVEKALEEIGKDKDFTVILEKASPGVVYAHDSVDITDLVIQKLNDND